MMLVVVGVDLGQHGAAPSATNGRMSFVTPCRQPGGVNRFLKVKVSSARHGLVVVVSTIKTKKCSDLSIEYVPPYVRTISQH